MFAAQQIESWRRFDIKKKKKKKKKHGKPSLFLFIRVIGQNLFVSQKLYKDTNP